MIDLFIVYALKEVDADAQIFEIEGLPSVGGWCDDVDEVCAEIVEDLNGRRIKARSGKGTRDIHFRFHGDDARRRAAKARIRIRLALTEFGLDYGSLGGTIIEPHDPEKEAKEGDATITFHDDYSYAAAE